MPGQRTQAGRRWRVEFKSMLESIEQPGPLITDGDVNELETRFQVALPKPYRRFLSTWNGGRPKPDTYHIEGLANNPQGALQLFYGIRYPIAACALEEQIEFYRPLLPHGVIPIAATGGLGQVCLCWHGAREGEVLYWDGYHKPEEPCFENIYSIAPSFEDLLKVLHEWVPPPGHEDPLWAHMAKKFSPQDVMDLLERGVDLNRPDSYDRTLIEWAAIHNRLDLVELLVARGLPVRQALAYAEQNLEFFPEYAVLADYLRKLSPGPT